MDGVCIVEFDNFLREVFNHFFEVRPRVLDRFALEREEFFDGFFAVSSEEITSEFIHCSALVEIASTILRGTVPLVPTSRAMLTLDPMPALKILPMSKPPAGNALRRAAFVRISPPDVFAKHSV